MEELADAAVEELREFIDTESQLLQEAHKLSDKLNSWELIFQHFDEEVYDENLHKFYGLIIDEIEKLVNFINSDRFLELKFIKEEQEELSNIEEHIEHRDWKIIKKEESKVLKLKHHEIKELHSKFMDLMKLMKKSKLIKSIEEDLTTLKEKEQFEKQEEYYALEIYKFARAYERIFRHLWRKEMILARKK